MSRQPAQKGATRSGARTFTRRFHNQNPRQIGSFRGHHRLRPDRRRSIRCNLFSDPARHWAGHHAARCDWRQGLFQQGKPGSSPRAWHSAGDPPQSQREEQAGLVRQDPLQSPRPHRARLRPPQTLQARRTEMRENREKFQINRELRRRTVLDQIRPHGLMSSNCSNAMIT